MGEFMTWLNSMSKAHRSLHPIYENGKSIGTVLFTFKACYYSSLLRETFLLRSIRVPRVPNKVYFLYMVGIKGCDIDCGELRRGSITYISWCFMCRCLGEKSRSSCCIVRWLYYCARWSLVNLKHNG